MQITIKWFQLSLKWRFQFFSFFSFWWRPKGRRSSKLPSRIRTSGLTVYSKSKNKKIKKEKKSSNWKIYSFLRTKIYDDERNPKITMINDSFYLENNTLKHCISATQNRCIRIETTTTWMSNLFRCSLNSLRVFILGSHFFFLFFSPVKHFHLSFLFSFAVRCFISISFHSSVLNRMKEFRLIHWWSSFVVDVKRNCRFKSDFGECIWNRCCYIKQCDIHCLLELPR